MINPRLDESPAEVGLVSSFCVAPVEAAVVVRDPVVDPIAVVTTAVVGEPVVVPRIEVVKGGVHDPHAVQNSP
jgi:hypothetical protein